MRVQLKSVPEKHLGEFNTKMFVDKIVFDTAEYQDPNMILAYLLQPSIERIDTVAYYKMIEEISLEIDKELPVKDILFISRRDMETYEYIQVYKQVKISQVSAKDSVQKEIRDATQI